MCGIVGLINFDQQKVEEGKIKKMMTLLKHRGPDDEGTMLNNTVGLGFVRLSIIDLTKAGHQPMISDDGRYTIIFNGEIYNYLELKKELEGLGIKFYTNTDTEVLLKAYIKWGEECQHKFNGMWAFVIYDKVEDSIFASRDRFGIKPFYYIHTKEFFAFASEIPALLSLIEKKPTPNFKVIFEYLIYNRTDQTENTFFSEINKLQHGSKINIKDQQVKIQKWYDLKLNVSKTKGFKSPDEYKELIISAVSLCMRSDLPVGVCLSGGIDSSTITSVLIKELNKPDVNTFSAVYNIGQAGNESEFIDEYKNILANRFYITPNSQSLLKDLQEFTQTHSEPMPSTSPYAQYKLMELAKKHVTVTLDGQGADEQLAGYHDFFGFYFKDLVLSGRIGTLSSETYNYIKEHNSTYGLKTFFYFLLPVKARTKIRIKKIRYLEKEFLKYGNNNDTIALKLYGSDSLKNALINHFEYKLEHLLKWEDSNSMHFSVEARVPFLDYRLVEKTLASADNWKIRKGITKYILRESMKNVLPEKIRTRKDKIGFETPQDEWFRTSQWEKIIKETISSESFKKRRIINPEIALQLYQRHLNGKENISKEIWKWLNLELWFKKYID
ncbi:MAG: asparagine synthase (glutamine-hydrolyzing) [Bacteroidia bacterium]|nr:asparagine synthase (glutamine-hydrolyzing) [Bacteroidia bacterium]